MAEKLLSNQMKELSLEPDKILGNSLEIELNFCLKKKDQFLKSTLEQRAGLRFVYGKLSINFFFCLKKGYERQMHIQLVQLLKIVLKIKCTV